MWLWILDPNGNIYYPRMQKKRKYQINNETTNIKINVSWLYISSYDESNQKIQSILSICFCAYRVFCVHFFILFYFDFSFVFVLCSFSCLCLKPLFILSVSIGCWIKQFGYSFNIKYVVRLEHECFNVYRIKFESDRYNNY